MSLGNIKKKKRLLALLLCTILAGASFMTGCGSKADENGSAQVSAEEKNVTETQEQTEAESEQIMTEATETAQTKTQETGSYPVSEAHCFQNLFTGTEHERRCMAV